MKVFLFLLAVSFTGSSLLPGASSIRTQLDGIPGSRTVFDVQHYGAEANGITENSKAFIAAWNAACSSTQSSTLYIPEGTFLVAPVSFEGPCQNAEITVQVTGDLIAPTDNSLWNDDNKFYWLQFSNVDALTINGGGRLDGQGSSWWTILKKNQQFILGPASLRLAGITNTVVRGITSINSKQFHISIVSCNNVLAEGLSIKAPAHSPNTDGIHVSSSSNVKLRNIVIGTGDDCIGILEGTSNLNIEQVTCGPGHGISVGSLGRYPSRNGVINVTVNGVSFRGTQNGVRIKTLKGGKGFANGLTFENIKMDNVTHPIIIDQYYCPSCSAQESNVKISNVLYKNITGTSAKPEAIDFACSDSVPCEGIKVEDVNLNYRENEAHSLCKNAKKISAKSVQPPLAC